MHDPFPALWADKMARLPSATTLTLHIEPNREAEEMPCFFCRTPNPVEWLVHWRTYRESCTSGLCEACRERSTPKEALLSEEEPKP